jgi:hypothetical protein
MAPLAALAPFAPAIGAGLQGFFGWLGSRGQAKATRSAADIQSRAALQAGRWQQETAREQRAFLEDQAEIQRVEDRRVERANWEMDQARERRLYGQAGDEMFNLYGLNRQKGRMGYEETAADRFNTRAELLANIKREYGRYAPQQRRVGRLGALMGAPQPPGGREIPSMQVPGALQQPDFVEMPDPQQTAFNYPKYRTPQQWEGYTSSADAAQEARTNETARAAAASGMTVADYMRQQRWDRRADERERRT